MFGRRKTIVRGLPEVLVEAGRELRDASSAWALVQQPGLHEMTLLQYVAETEYAVKRCAALLDEWLTLGVEVDPW
jgi:hypothetical protein